ncbi:unnamed protein product [Allacma fusca]|uniref:Uncharacterized protein n=1 Tax=Allacma fusca TaxID=39272 RepID=A0A8J2LEU4_9HEXA|nr:unnamed protein product [Allacma fusca]
MKNRSYQNIYNENVDPRISRLAICENKSKGFKKTVAPGFGTFLEISLTDRKTHATDEFLRTEFHFLKAYNCIQILLKHVLSFYTPIVLPSCNFILVVIAICAIYGFIRLAGMKTLVSLLPLRWYIAEVYYADCGLVITIFSIILENTVNLLMQCSRCTNSKGV